MTSVGKRERQGREEEERRKRKEREAGKEVWEVSKRVIACFYLSNVVLNVVWEGLEIAHWMICELIVFCDRQRSERVHVRFTS